MIDVRAALRLYLVADESAFLSIVERALRGGVTMVQLRNKIWPDDVAMRVGSQLIARCRAAGVPCIINDRVDLALALGADGVHLGVGDTPIEDSRRMAANEGVREFLIGYSPDTDADLRTAAARGADYLGIGPIYPTASKQDAGAALGIAEFSRRIRHGNLPTVGIGGVDQQHARQVLDAGADGIAVVSAIMLAGDPRAAANQLLN